MRTKKIQLKVSLKMEKLKANTSNSKRILETLKQLTFSNRRSSFSEI